MSIDWAALEAAALRGEPPDDALALARINVRRHDVDARVGLQKGDMLHVPERWNGGFDAVPRRFSQSLASHEHG